MVKNNLPVPSLQRTLDFFIELILTSILIISPFLFGSVEPFYITIIELGAFSILFLWWVKSVKQGSFEFIALPINKPITIFLIFVLIQYFFINFFIYDFQLGEIYSQKIKKETLKLISYLIFFYIILNNFQERKKINRLIYVLIFIGFVLSFLGIIQKLSGTKRIFWISQVPCSEYSFASFPNRNHFANYINMIIFLTFGILFSKFPVLREYIKGLDKESIIKGVLVTFQKGIWLYVFGLIVMASSLFYSISRGGIVSFLCGVIFFSILMLIKGLTKRGYLLLIAILIFTFAMLVWINAPEQIMQRFSGADKLKGTLMERILGGRKIYIDTGIDLIRAYPIFGVGFGAFEFIYNKRYGYKFLIPDNQTQLYIDHLHNDFVELFCEVGFIGFFIFLITACIYVTYTIKTILKRHDPFVIGIGIGCMAGLFSMCVHSLFDFNFHITSNAVLFFTLTGLAIVAANSQIREGKETNLLANAKLFLVKSLFFRILILIILSVTFFYVVKSIISPYIAYRISEEDKTSIASLKEAIRLDPLNDKYHFLLAKFFIKEAGIRRDNAQKYARIALKEVREAIRLNPWNEYYPVYLRWIINAFNL